MNSTRNETKIRLTRKQRVIVTLLIVFFIVPQCCLLVIQVWTPKWITWVQPIMGPSKGATIQVSDIRVNIKTKADAVVFMTITLSSGEKYGANVTIPIYSLTKGGEN